jgi:hypothetical protein
MEPPWKPGSFSTSTLIKAPKAVDRRLYFQHDLILNEDGISLRFCSQSCQFNVLRHDSQTPPSDLFARLSFPRIESAILRYLRQNENWMSFYIQIPRDPWLSAPPKQTEPLRVGKLLLLSWMGAYDGRMELSDKNANQ